MNSFREYRMETNYDNERRQRVNNAGKGTAGDRQKKPRPSIASIKEAITTCGAATIIVKCFLVRICLVLGNMLTAWRVVLETEDRWQWAWSFICAVLMMIECSIAVYKNRGKEWKWWCPCFVVYLGTTLPLIWILQFEQHFDAVDALTSTDNNVSASGSSAMALVNTTNSSLTTTTEMDNTKLNEIGISRFYNLEDYTWIVIVTQSIIYLIVLGRWFLPRGKVSREFLAGLLLEYLAVASDIMELLAILDEDEQIRINYELHVWILTVWSISFIQFIPILMHKRQFKQPSSSHFDCIRNTCGEYFVEILSTFMSIFLQDAPFLAVRLYVIIELDFITYSLVFFLLKNIVSVFLLCYRLFTLLCKLKCCCGCNREDVDDGIPE